MLRQIRFPDGMKVARKMSKTPAIVGGAAPMVDYQ
jgi:hypothetical protein